MMLWSAHSECTCEEFRLQMRRGGEILVSSKQVYKRVFVCFVFLYAALWQKLDLRHLPLYDNLSQLYYI